MLRRLFLLACVALVALPTSAGGQSTVTLYAGTRVCALDLSTIANTTWNDLTSADFFDQSSADGTACPSGAAILALSCYMGTGTADTRLALSSRDAADPALNGIVCPGAGAVSLSLYGVQSRAGGVTTISVKKSASGDAGYLLIWVNE